MNADQCPRCGLPANWTLKLHVRFVLAGFVLAAAAGFTLGAIVL